MGSPTTRDGWRAATILFSSCLIQQDQPLRTPLSVIDYVMVHELAHLIEANHTPQFWNIVKAQIANMDKSKQWLKEHGQLLEQAVLVAGWNQLHNQALLQMANPQHSFA